MIRKCRSAVDSMKYSDSDYIRKILNLPAWAVAPPDQIVCRDIELVQIVWRECQTCSSGS